MDVPQTVVEDDRSAAEQLAAAPITRPSARTEAHRRSLTLVLFERVEGTRDEVDRRVLRSSIICVNMPMAAAVARRFDHRGEARDDLSQVAYLALAKATQRFRLAERKDFLTFAVPTIRGELNRYFRDHTWAVRPPWRVQHLQARIRTAGEEHVHAHGVPPSPEDLARLLGASESDVVEALVAAGCWNALSLDSPVGETGRASMADLLPADEDPAERVERRRVLAPALAALDEPEREMISLWLFHDWSQERIGRERGMTQVQVSRAISHALARARQHIGDVA